MLGGLLNRKDQSMPIVPVDMLLKEIPRGSLPEDGTPATKEQIRATEAWLVAYVHARDKELISIDSRRQACQATMSTLRAEHAQVSQLVTMPNETDAQRILSATAKSVDFRWETIIRGFPHEPLAPLSSFRKITPSELVDQIQIRIQRLAQLDDMLREEADAKSQNYLQQLVTTHRASKLENRVESTAEMLCKKTIANYPIRGSAEYRFVKELMYCLPPDPSQRVHALEAALQLATHAYRIEEQAGELVRSRSTEQLNAELKRAIQSGNFQSALPTCKALLHPDHASKEGLHTLWHVYRCLGCDALEFLTLQDMLTEGVLLPHTMRRMYMLAELVKPHGRMVDELVAHLKSNISDPLAALILIELAMCLKDDALKGFVSSHKTSHPITAARLAMANGNWKEALQQASYGYDSEPNPVLLNEALLIAAISAFHDAGEPTVKRRDHPTLAWLAPLLQGSDDPTAWRLLRTQSDPSFLHTFLPTVRTSSYDCLVLEGYVAMENKQYDRAIQILLSAKQVDPSREVADCGLGLVYTKQNQPAKALLHYKNALVVCPSSPAAGQGLRAWHAANQPKSEVQTPQLAKNMIAYPAPLRAQANDYLKKHFAGQKVPMEGVRQFLNGSCPSFKSLNQYATRGSRFLVAGGEAQGELRGINSMLRDIKPDISVEKWTPVAARIARSFGPRADQSGLKTFLKHLHEFKGLIRDIDPSAQIIVPPDADDALRDSVGGIWELWVVAINNGGKPDSRAISDLKDGLTKYERALSDSLLQIDRAGNSLEQLIQGFHASLANPPRGAQTATR